MTFYMAMVNVNPGLGVTDVQQLLKGIGFYRVANNVWILYTDNGIDWLNDRLQPVVKPSGTLLIMKLDPRVRKGWMNKDFWAWVRESLGQ